MFRDISMLDQKTGTPSPAVNRVIDPASALLPTDGLAARMIISASRRPPVRASRSMKPVAMPSDWPDIGLFTGVDSRGVYNRLNPQNRRSPGFELDFMYEDLEPTAPSDLPTTAETHERGLPKKD